MVSPSVSTPARVQPLSYADRAKKAQNIKSPNSVPPPHTVAHSAPPPSGSNTSTASDSTTLSNSFASQSNSNPTSVDVTPSSSIILTTRPSSPLPHTADVPDIKPMNGDLRATKDLTLKSPSTAAAQSSPQKLPPTVNVWSLRKEQMAAQAQAARTPSTQTMPQISQPPVMSRNPATPRPPPSRPYSDTLPNGPHGLTSIKSNHGLTSPVVTASDDPFVVRLPAQNSRAPRLPLPIPAVDDTESWPEVGKSLSSTAMPSLHNPPVMDVLPGTKDEGESTKGPETVKPVSVTPRKSEKTKWVPIPPEELQAASDATVQAFSRQSHSRNQSQHAHPLVKPTRNHTQGSGSCSGQGQSRNHSGRNSTAQSASQSRVHSRAGSMHSSPRHPRGRRLPGDDGPDTGTTGQGGVTAGVVSNSPSTSSPQPQAYVDPGLSGSIAYPTPMYGPAPAQVGSGPTTYYPQQPSHLPPTIPQNQNQQHSQHYRHSSSHSPLNAPYGLSGPGVSANGYHPSQSPALPPQPQGYAGGHSPYQLYPPYGQLEYTHGPTQPYMYWNGLPGSGQHSPSYPPPHASHFRPPHHRQQHGDIGRPDGEVPPPTMIVRPPPPGESQAVAGYRALGPVTHAGGDVALKTTERPVVFGSIGIPGASKCPSPAPPSSSGGNDCVEEGDVSEKAFTAFSIGIAPGEGAPSRLRSRTRSSTARSRTETATENGRHMSDLTNGEIREVVGEVRKKVLCKDEGSATGAANGDMKVIDLTDTETRWEFGTTGHPEVDENPVSPPGPERQQPPSTMISPRPAYGHQLPMVPTIPGSDSPILPMENPVPLPMSLTSPMEVQITSPPVSAPFPIQGLRPVLFSAEINGQGGSDEWEVKDFGYGFGPASGTGYAATITREGRLARERERARQREREKAERAERERAEREIEMEREREQERERVRERDMEREKERTRELEFARPRRGSYSGYGGYERGGFGGRRGRGGNGGYSGRGFNRHLNRGTYQPSQQQRQPPFSITPPPHFQPLVPLNDPSNAYYPPQQHLMTYIPSSFESYQPPPPAPTPAPAPAPPQLTPPVPVPLSSLSFPLDPVRWYLLGQLEYYLSPQNMAQDFFLRQQMDSRGWIPISLISSFNRVRQLTMDAQLVRNVLILSTLVQVKEDWVRMGGWEQFVLPDAPRSTVEGFVAGPFEAQALPYHEDKGDVYIRAEGEVEDGEGDGEGDGECEVEEDEEEDVVFVMGREAGSWSPERPT